MTLGERLHKAHDMAKAKALRVEIVRATRFTADQVDEIVRKAPERIVASRAEIEAENDKDLASGERE